MSRQRQMQRERFASDSANDEALLDLLHEIETNGAATQRSLAQRLGVALGLTNAYLKRCGRKGWIKAQQVPARRYAYYLTPKGFREKSRLTGEYLRLSLSFFRQAREECLVTMLGCERRGILRIALYGDGELTEIATLAARETSVDLVGVIAPGSNRSQIASLPTFPQPDNWPECDAILITESRQPQSAYDEIRKRLEDSSICVLPLLKITRTPSVDIKEAAE